jgi:hypothetical protein
MVIPFGYNHELEQLGYFVALRGESNFRRVAAHRSPCIDNVNIGYCVRVDAMVCGHS